MSEKISIQDLDGLKKVHDVMVGLTLPDLNPDALKSVGKMEGETFKKAIVSYANADDDIENSKSYLFGVTSLLTGPVLSCLASLGYVSLPYETLIKIGKSCAREFRTQLSAAARNDKSGKEWIQQKINEYSGNKPDNAPSPAAEAPSRPSTQSSSSNVRNIDQSRPQQSHVDDYVPASSRNRPAATAQPDTSKDQREYFGVTFYGGKAALCFNANEKDGEHSINLDAGNRIEGQKKVNWDDAIHFRFSTKELLTMYWVLIGVRESCEFKGHGATNDKSFQMKRQDNGFFASCQAKGMNSRGLPMSEEDAFELGSLILRQMQLNNPHMTTENLMMMARAVTRPALKVANG